MFAAAGTRDARPPMDPDCRYGDENSCFGCKVFLKIVESLSQMCMDCQDFNGTHLVDICGLSFVNWELKLVCSFRTGLGCVIVKPSCVLLGLLRFLLMIKWCGFIRAGQLRWRLCQFSVRKFFTNFPIKSRRSWFLCRGQKPGFSVSLSTVHSHARSAPWRATARTKEFDGPAGGNN